MGWILGSTGVWTLATSGVGLSKPAGSPLVFGCGPEPAGPQLRLLYPSGQGHHGWPNTFVFVLRVCEPGSLAHRLNGPLLMGL